MTCIVGVRSPAAVYVGGDSAGSNGSNMEIRADPKVFRRGEFIVGYTTSYRMGQLLRFEFNPALQKPDMSNYEYMSTVFVNAVRDCLRTGGYLRKKEDVEEGGEFIVAYRGDLYKIESDFQVGQSIHPYTACGSGYQVALGALYAMITDEASVELLEQDYDDVVRTALSAAAEHSAFVRGPYVIESQPR